MLGLFEIQLNEKLLYHHDFNGNTFIHTAIRFHTPAIDLLRYQKDSWGEWYREIGFRCPTTLIFHKSEFFWSFNLSLLGFGISLAHQNGY